MLCGKNIILIGLKGSGKTTVAQVMARQYPEYEYIDTDELIKKIYKKTNKVDLSIPYIYEAIGEDKFRMLERQAIKYLCSSIVKDKKYIIATGGGAVLNSDNVKMLKKMGCLIYLACNPILIYKRWQITNIRPSFLVTEHENEFISHANSRVEIYKKIADKSIDIDNLDILKIVENIWQVIVLENCLG